MQRYFARIIRAIIVSALGFGGGVGLLTFIVLLVLTGTQKASSVGLHVAIGIGLVFGFLLALLLLLIDLTPRLMGSKANYKEIWELSQNRNVALSGNQKEIRQWARSALLAVPNVKSVTDVENGMNAVIGPSWKSPGEIMEINIKQNANDQFDVRCTSACLSPTVAFDYAKNFENVEAWLRELKLQSGKSR